MIFVVIYLALRVAGLVHSIGVEEILLGFVGGQALLDIHLIRSISRLEGKMSMIERKMKI